MNTQTALAQLAATNQPHQITLMEQVVDLLTGCDPVTHLMVRGSLAAGTSDRLSDVDLVVGVDPDHFVRFTAAQEALINASFGTLLPAWRDTIVPQWGGIGWVYLVHHQDAVYQLDLYVAPSHQIEAIAAASDGTMIFTAGRTPGEDSPVVAEFVQTQLNRAPTCRELLVELLVLGWLIHKRLLRGQTYMAYKEAHQFTAAARGLARTGLSPHTAHLGWYHLDTILGATPLGRECLTDLDTLVTAPPVPTPDSLRRMLDTALTIAGRAAPEALDELAEAVAAYRHYLDIG